MPSGKEKEKEKVKADGAKASQKEKAAKATEDRPRANQATRLATTAKATASYATSRVTGATNAHGRKR